MKYSLIGKNIPSSKNNKMWTGKMLINNKLTMQFYKWAEPIIQAMKPDILQELAEKTKPYKFHFYFYRDSKRRWDFANIVQSISDMLVYNGVVEDDNTKIYIPVYDGEEVTDKNHAGVTFYIE